MKTITLMYLSIIFSAFLLLNQNVFAQRNIIGEVKGQYGVPIPCANVLLLNPLDSSLVSGNISDEDGYYILSNVSTGKYLMSISGMGYETIYSKLISVKDKSGFYAMETIQLEKNINVSQEQQAAIFEQKVDRIIVNVKNSMINIGHTALEILSRSPEMIVNTFHSIQMQGRKKLVIMIDGKVSQKSMQMNIELLNNLEANEIERIELIHTSPTNVQAKQHTGFVNIILKKKLKKKKI